MTIPKGYRFQVPLHSYLVSETEPPAQTRSAEVTQAGRAAELERRAA